MICLRCLLIALSLLALPACAMTVASSFVTVDTPVPASAKDSREDGVLRDRDGRPVRHALLGEVLPEFEAETLDGAIVSSAEFAGQWTVLTAWGVWCHDSRNDAAHMNALAETVAAEAGLGFLSVHMPFSAEHTDISFRDYGSVAGFFEARNVSWPTIIDEDASLRQRLHIEWTPSYLIVGPDLTVRGFRTDFSVAEEGALAAFVEDVKRLMAEG